MNTSTRIITAIFVLVLLLACTILLWNSTWINNQLNQNASIPILVNKILHTSFNEVTVTLTRSGFSPSTVTIKVGQTVVWENKSGQKASVNSNDHPTNLLYPPLNLGIFANGQHLQLTFPKTGSYGYHNYLNPSQTATVIVQ